MKQKFQNLCLGVLVLFSTIALAQNSPVSVNNLTGTASVTIPLFTVTSGSLSVPVFASYSATGVKIKAVEGSAGIGWNLIADGGITREVRGLPDDYKLDSAANIRWGWLYNSNGSSINSFSIANDANNTTSSCSDEATDRTYMNSNFTGNSDTEPDAYYVNAPGLSCQLVFANDHTLHTIPYIHLKISYATDAHGAISSFTITNDHGVTYVFNLVETAYKRTISSSPGSIAYFKRFYDQYKDGITYNACWKLTSMTDANLNAITFNYYDMGDRGFQNPVSVVIDGSRTDQYTISGSNNFKRLWSIASGHSDDVYTTRLTFTYDATEFNVPFIANVSGFGKTYNFNYTTYTPVANGYPRLFLTGISEGANGQKDYSFEYLRRASGVNSIALPDSTSKSIDLWGYYNNSGAANLLPQVYINPSNTSYEKYRAIDPGSATSSFPHTISGYSRSADPSWVLTGALNKITYLQGGYTKLTYESNDFYDNTAATTVYGNGIRIKEIADYDDVDSTKKMVHTFSYTNPSSVSSGKPISMPVYAFTRPYSGSYSSAADQWSKSTVVSDLDLSSEDHQIIYQYVRETRSGAGSVLYEYNVPGTYWDAGTSAWAPTATNIARSGCADYGVINNDKNTYPFAPNPNYDYERGLLKKSTVYNESGTEVSETNYTYTLAASPYAITGLQMEDMLGVTAYSKYLINASTNELMTQQSTKIYDAATLSKVKETAVNYTYNSPYQKPVQIQNTNSDGSTATSYTKYTRDYNVSTHSDAVTTALYHLQQMNVNVPVEKYYQVTRGGSTVTTGAELIKFNTFTNAYYPDYYLPAQQLKFFSASGTSFTPSSISSGTFVYDSGYIPVSNNLSYDYRGYPQTADDNNRHVNTVLTDHYHTLPVAAFSNAKVAEVSFTNFDSNIQEYGFTRQSGSYTYSSNSRDGGKSLSLEASANMVRTLTKNPLAGNYVFSIWINSASTGSLSFSLISGGTTNTYSMSFANTAGKWQYYEKILPLTGMGSTFAIQFQSNAAILIDDILAYPDVSQASTTAYKPVSFLKAAETNTNGVSVYYSYDTLNRVRFIYDQDKQIIQKRSYVENADYASYPTPSIAYTSPGSPANYRVPISFINAVPPSPSINLEGLTYTWNFGDGSATVTTKNLNAAKTHIYNAAGTYTVTLTMVSPLFGTKTTTTSVTIYNYSDIPVHIYSSSRTGGNSTSIQVYQGTTWINTFSQTDLETGTVTLPQGLYTFKVYVTGFAYNSANGEGYGSILTDFGGCQAYANTTHAEYDFYGDLNGKSSISFTIQTGACEFGGGGEQ